MHDPSAPHREHGLLALLGACLLAFGVFIPWLGFYQDDWHFIYYANQGLSKLWELSAYDNRPFASWPYIGGFALLGFHPLAWQVAGIVLRWLTAAAFWLFLRALWPERARLLIVPALLFAVYPLYTLQPMAVTYITHWVCYLLYFISLWLMVLAIRTPDRFWPFFILSILLDTLQLFTIEYFNGIELLRPVVLWMALSIPEKPSPQRIGRVIRLWAPYLLALLAFILWRGLVFQSPAQDNNAPTVLRELLTSPLETILYLLGAVFKDSILILFGAWSATLTPLLVDLTPVGLAILLLAVLTFVAFYFYLKNFPLRGEWPAANSQMALLGLLGLLLGPIPAWVTHQPLYDTNPLWNSRLGMASMFGAALLLCWAVESAIRTPKQKIFIYALLLALAAGFLLRSGNIYRIAWEREVSFLNQLAVRAPSIEPGTAIISEGEVLSLMGDYPTAFAANMAYSPIAQDGEARLWYFPTNVDDPIAEKIYLSGDIHERKFSTRFNGNGRNILVVWYDVSTSPCLHILTPQDSDSRLYSDFLRSIARYSDNGRISSDPSLNTKIFSQALKTPPTWCTYYQQAELAAQQGDWPAVSQIWDSAQSQGFAPLIGAEMLPFLRASLALGKQADAEALTRAGRRADQQQGHAPDPLHSLAAGWSLPEILPLE